MTQLVRLVTDCLGCDILKSFPVSGHGLHDPARLEPPDKRLANGWPRSTDAPLFDLPIARWVALTIGAVWDAIAFGCHINQRTWKERVDAVGAPSDERAAPSRD